MKQIFHRQIAAYAQYHRDPHNCLTHFIGIPMLFLAVILPLEAWRDPDRSPSGPACHHPDAARDRGLDLAGFWGRRGVAAFAVPALHHRGAH
jgi:hypothetical protein